MANKTLNTRIIIRNDTKAAWQSANPVLRKGEIGIVFDPSAEVTHVTNFKVGDGVTAWNSLPLMITEESVEALAQRVAALEEKVDVSSVTAAIASAIADEVNRADSAYDHIGAASNALSAANAYTDQVVGDFATGSVISGINTRIGELQSATASLGSRVGNLESATASLAGRIDSLDSQMVGIPTNGTVTATIAAGVTEAKGYTDAQIDVVTASIASVSSVADTASSNATSALNRLDVVQGGASITGSIAAQVAAEAARASGVEQGLDARIDALEGNHFVIVQTLPATGETNVIYLVPKASPATGYKEWVYIKTSSNPDTYAWEEIGDTDIDLSNYYTKSEVDNIASVNLAAAEQYAHDQATATLASANLYADNLATVTLASANATASGYASGTLASAKAYTDQVIGDYATGSIISGLSSRIGAIESDYLTAADSYILDCGNASTNITVPTV